MTALCLPPIPSYPKDTDVHDLRPTPLLHLRFHRSAAERLVADLGFSQKHLPTSACRSHGSAIAQTEAKLTGRIGYHALVEQQREFVNRVGLHLQGTAKSKNLRSTGRTRSNALETAAQVANQSHQRAFPTSLPLPCAGPENSVTTSENVPRSSPQIHPSVALPQSTTVNPAQDPFLNDSLDLTFDDPVSPILQQAHPQLNPPEYYNARRRPSVLSLENTLQPPRPPVKKGSKNTVQATQGDAVLISFLAPDQHEVSRHAGLYPLLGSSESESTENEMEGEGGVEGDGNAGNAGNRTSPETGGRDAGNDDAAGAPNGNDSGSNDNSEGSGGQSSSNGGGSGSSGDGDGDKGKKQPPNPSMDMDVDTEENAEEKKPEAREDKEQEKVDSQLKVEAAANTANDLLAGVDQDMDMEATSSSETAASLMSLAGGAISSMQTYNDGVFSNNNGGAMETNPNSASPESAKKDASNKLSPPLPSMIPQTSSPSSLPPGPGHEGKHITLPPLSSLNSIDVLADLASKENQSSPPGYRRASGSQTLYPNIVAHSSIVPTTKPSSNATPPSPSLPSPAGTGGFSPEGGPRPPMHHLSAQQRQYYLNIGPEGSPYYPNHPHQHYQSPYPPIKDASSPGSAQVGYPAGFQPGRELPGLMHPSSPNSANFFAQPGAMPGGIPSARRESTSSEFHFSDQTTTPSGPNTGDTMTGTEETIASPRNRIMSGSGQAGLTGGGFKCDHPGCKAPPFQTQYLLNSHANVHSQNRPHYCPVKGCPRAEGGKGFKRKNEMIRHGLVHDSPGYVCPFCPDREHKYPRPDNLQRHVRVHHMDKDKDDPQLRDVLSQRPEGGRGRRRRLGA